MTQLKLRKLLILCPCILQIHFSSGSSAFEYTKWATVIRWVYLAYYYQTIQENRIKCKVYILYLYIFLYLYPDVPKGPPVQFPGRARPPTSFGAPPGAPSAPGAPFYPPMGFSNAPPTSFGMPQPYGQSPTPYPTQTMHPTPKNTPMHSYPPQQMPYPTQPMPTPYPPNPGQPMTQAPYPRQQSHNVYPNLQQTPEARACFNNTASSPYPHGLNTHATSSALYQGGNHPGGQGVSSKYPYSTNPPTAAPRRATPAPQFTPKVRLIAVYKALKKQLQARCQTFFLCARIEAIL